MAIQEAPIPAMPPASAAVHIANALEKLAREAGSLGYRQLAESIASVVIEASEEARRMNPMTY